MFDTKKTRTSAHIYPRIMEIWGRGRDGQNSCGDFDICVNDTQLGKVSLVFSLQTPSAEDGDPRNDRSIYLRDNTHSYCAEKTRKATSQSSANQLCSGTHPFLSIVAFFRAFILRHETPNVPRETRKEPDVSNRPFFPSLDCFGAAEKQQLPPAVGNLC